MQAWVYLPRMYITHVPLNGGLDILVYVFWNGIVASILTLLFTGVGLLFRRLIVVKYVFVLLDIIFIGFLVCITPDIGKEHGKKIEVLWYRIPYAYAYLETQNVLIRNSFPKDYNIFNFPEYLTYKTMKQYFKINQMNISEHKDWWSARIMIASPNINSVDNEILEVEYIDGSHYGSDRVYVKIKKQCVESVYQQIIKHYGVPNYTNQDYRNYMKYVWLTSEPIEAEKIYYVVLYKPNDNYDYAIITIGIGKKWENLS
jgi:hypothetical protein